MNLLFWITVGFIGIGFVVLVSMKKGMEARVNLIAENKESTQLSPKPVIWWIVGTLIWGIVSIYLVVQSFYMYN